MQFIVTMMQAAGIEGRAVVQADGETPEAIASRLRSAFLENARRMREARSVQVMTERTMNQFADIAHRIALEQAASGTARYVTLHTCGGEDVHEREGQVAILTSNRDITGMVEVVDDRTLKQNSFQTMAERKLGRQLLPQDVVLDEDGVDDLFES